ncbi:rCG63661, partial [Rattus norvegicus]
MGWSTSSEHFPRKAMPQKSYVECILVFDCLLLWLSKKGFLCWMPWNVPCRLGWSQIYRLPLASASYVDIEDLAHS